MSSNTALSGRRFLFVYINMMMVSKNVSEKRKSWECLILHVRVNVSFLASPVTNSWGTNVLPAK